jgi:hypothetical protein
MSTVKGKIKILGDGKGHYVTYVPFAQGDDRQYLFYGDGKAMYMQRPSGGFSSQKPIRENFRYWEPRARAEWTREDNKYFVTCDEKKTEFKPIAAAEEKRLLDSPIWKKVKWKYMAYALARDSEGNYYYIDKQREPEKSKKFRVWIGPKGDVKPQKMKNIVSDSDGDIFITENGQLRLVLDKGEKEAEWVQGKEKTALKHLEVENNIVLIYSELGVYANETLGTPCDDLM